MNATVLVLLLSASMPSSASFDCREARTSTEKMICGDSELADADQQLSRLYARLLSVNDDVDARKLRNEQRRWLKSRDEFCNNAHVCARVYKERIADLKILLSGYQPPLLSPSPLSMAGEIVLDDMVVMSRCASDSLELELAWHGNEKPGFIVHELTGKSSIGCPLNEADILATIEVFPGESGNYFCAAATKADLHVMLNGKTVVDSAIVNYCNMHGLTSLSISNGFVEACGYEKDGRRVAATCIDYGEIGDVLVGEEPIAF